MEMTAEQRKILQAIAAAEPVRGDAATWAVTAGWAVQAEDGDIDLTEAGRDALTCLLYTSPSPRDS
mgnify:CR=1 FL=1